MSKLIKTSLIGIDGPLAFSKSEVYVFYNIPTTPYDFLDYGEREIMASRINNALAALATSATKSVEGHLIVTSSPLDIEKWKKEWAEVVSEWNPTDGFEKYSYDMAEHLYESNFSMKEVYIGINLGKRTGDSESTLDVVKNTIKSLGDAFGSALGAEDYQISEQEMKIWENKSRDITRILTTGALKAVPATPAQIAMLFKKTLYPAMPTPPIEMDDTEKWGYGDVLTLSESFIEPHRKFLKITQIDPYTGKDVIGYRATLCFAKFPDVMEFPDQEPWIHSAALLGTQFDFYTRFTIEPSAKVRKAVERKIQEIKDEAINASGADRRNIPLDIQERLSMATSLEHELSKDTEPWLYGRHRIIITAPTEELLRDHVQRVTNLYRDFQIKVVWTTGDQLNLFLESQPADKVRVMSYLQKQSLSIISGGMPTANSSVGDRLEIKGGIKRGWIGPYLGETTSRIREPVFISPHALIARNQVPGVLVTGSPGGGKSFVAFTLTCQMACQGIWGIYIDPKADALPLKNIQGIGHVNSFDLQNGNDGLIDPFAIGNDEGEKLLLALETINLLVGGLNDEQNIALSEVLETVIKYPEPSLNKVVDHLQQSSNIAGKSLGTTLNMIRKLPFARLCFSPQKVVNLRPDQGLTIITLLGMNLPSATTPKSDYSLPERLSIAVMFLLTSFTRQLMISLNRSHPKFVVIDEAWTVASTATGLKMITEIARMGRSLNMGLVLVSQNAQDFDDEGLTNAISLKLAFRTKTQAEAEQVLKIYGMEPDSYNKSVLLSLENGECLLRDTDGRTTTVQVDAWNQEWREAFDSNPHTRKTKILAGRE